jgi:hypothetical protein
MIVTEEKIGSTKPTMAEDKGKETTKIEEDKKAIKDDTLGEGPLDQELGAESTGFTKQLGRLWVPCN